MKSVRWAVAVLLLAGPTALAHRLDEYLQGTLISVEKDRVSLQITLTPGVAVFPLAVAGLDTDGDGIVSASEQQAYAGHVLKDLTVGIDGEQLAPRVVSAQFPAIAEMREGRGEIHLELTADLPSGGAARKLVFENHHQSKISAYQVNALVPHDPDIRIVTQNRSYSQASWELDFVQTGVQASPWIQRWWQSVRDSTGIFALLLFGLFLMARVTWLWAQRTSPG